MLFTQHTDTYTVKSTGTHPKKRTHTHTEIEREKGRAIRPERSTHKLTLREGIMLPVGSHIGGSIIEHHVHLPGLQLLAQSLCTTPRSGVTGQGSAVTHTRYMANTNTNFAV